MKILESKITNVTVFKDRAEVTRQAKVEGLTAGEYQMVFDKLPKNIDQNSIQVNGKGNATLTNVKFETVHYEETPDLDSKTLYEEQQNIQDELRLLDDELNRLRKEKEFVDGVGKKLITPATTETTLELDPQKWANMLGYFKTELATVDQAIFGVEKNKRSWENKLHQINSQIQQMGQGKRLSKNQVTVWVETTQETSLALELSYIVYNASWRPVYDLRVSTQDKRMHITYNAIVEQNTGENWNDTPLKLSTAQPQISGQQPNLSPWRINLFVPKPPPAPAPGAARGMSNMIEAPMAQMYTSELDTGALMDELEEEIVMAKPASAVETGATSVFFSVSGKHTVKSDGTEHRVTIMIEDFSAHFRYSTVPKLSPYAYLKAKVRNETAYPFLAGSANVFLDNNFVSTTHMEAVAPTEEFWTFLGIDQGFKIEHKFLKKYEKQEGGIFSKKTQNIVYEYLIEIKNNKTTQEEIVVWDQLPISGNDEIKVHLLEPTYKEDSDKVKKNEYEYIEWFFKPSPGEALNIPFKFAVEYPRDKQVDGLI
ncbi:mucoidy inhibitor MuiA family protein [uncultured Microscilla sp.]|uniref:mucoidy inhibitor MuiA family protein n=1 Tax=uncultured Microscilla sp. TaxID=432653 RepID=UPI00260EC757|nr:mucoidy inhibitor MuiA family protein [uncultured Microscilla sp.]